jgi:hypothetical protein
MQSSSLVSYLLHQKHLNNSIAPSQRGEGARGVSGWLSNGAKARMPIGAAAATQRPRILASERLGRFILNYIRTDLP